MPKFDIYKILFFATVIVPILIFSPLSFDAFDLPKTLAVIFFSLILFLLFIFKKNKAKQDWSLGGVDTAVIFYCLILAISAIFSQDKISSLLGGLGAYSQWMIGLAGKLSSGLLVTIAFCLVYFSFNWGNEEKRFSANDFFKALVTSQTFCLVTFYLCLSGFCDSPQGAFLPEIMKASLKTLNVFSPLGRVIFPYAVFTAIILSLSIFKLSEKLTVAGNGKYFLSVFILLQLPIIWLANYFWAYVIFALCLLIYIFWEIWRQKGNLSFSKLFLPLLFVLISALFVIPQFSKLISSPLQSQVPNELVLPQNYSLAVAKNSLAAGPKDFAVGSGPGTFSYAFLKYRPAEHNKEMYYAVRWPEAGNYLAELATTTGLLGLLAFLALIFLAFVLSQKAGEVPLEADWIFPFLGGILVAFFFYHQSVWLLLMFWISLGLIAGYFGGQDKKFIIISYKWLGVGAILFSILFLYTAFIGFQFFQADLLYYRAIISGDRALAKDTLAQASSLNPYSESYQQDYARLSFAELLDFAKSNDIKKEVKAFGEKVIRVDNLLSSSTKMFPNRVAVWETKAAFYRELAPFEPSTLKGAIELLKRAQALDPNDPIILTELGKLYFSAGAIEEAQNSVALALQLKPDYIPATIEQALILEKQDKLSEAVVLLEGAYALYPQSDPDNLFQLGRLYFRQKNFAKAQPIFEAIISSYPNHSDSLFLLGEIYQQKGNQAEADEYFKHVLELNPGNPEVLKAMRRNIPMVPATSSKEIIKKN